MTFSITREIELRCIHRLENPALSEQENRDLYGICFGEHGHHYKVRVTVSGAPDPRSGLVMNREELDEILREELLEPYDGNDLNDLLPNTACEALAEIFYQKLLPRLGEKLRRVGIQETRKNYFEFPAAGAAAGTAP